MATVGGFPDPALPSLLEPSKTLLELQHHAYASIFGQEAAAAVDGGL